MTIQVAALYVAKNGCYFGLPHVDPWHEDRDARIYSGPYPVVAHPPCARWSRLANLNYSRYPKKKNQVGNDEGCFKCALDVRLFGGVLEHPASSKAFAAHHLPRPKFGHWQKTICGGWVTEIWQSAYGHRANKSTWLYFYSPSNKQPYSLKWEKVEGTHCVSKNIYRKKPTIWGKEASATPESFRDALIELALLA